MGYDPTRGAAPEQLVADDGEVGGVDRPLEPDEVAAGEAGGDLRPPRQAHEQLDRRERDVEEEADDQVRALGPQQLGDELEVVVVDPHDRPVGGDLGERVGEALVDRLVGLPVAGVVRRVAQGVVVQRPQRVVGEPLVVVLHLVARDEHGMQADAVLDERLGRVVGLARPADPGAVRRPQQRQQRPHEPARARRPASGCPGHRQPVGGDDDRPVRQRVLARSGLGWHDRQLGGVLLASSTALSDTR